MSNCGIQQFGICCHGSSFTTAAKVFTSSVFAHYIHQPNLSFNALTILELFRIMLSKSRPKTVTYFYHRLMLGSAKWSNICPSLLPPILGHMIVQLGRYIVLFLSFRLLSVVQNLHNCHLPDVLSHDLECVASRVNNVDRYPLLA